MGKPVVVVTRKLPNLVEDRMRSLLDARLNADDTPMSPQAMIDACDGADVLSPTVTDAIDADLIAALPGTVKLIANFGVGVNHIDLEAAASRAIAVANTPDVLTDDTADLAMALMLAVPRRLAEGDRLARTGGWTGWTPTFMVGRRVTGKKLGIVGMGRIGQAVARRARGFGMEIHYHNRRRLAEDTESALGAIWRETLDDMLAEMDFVSINCPQTEETSRLFDGPRLDRMARRAILINTARGGIVDEASLAERLADGRLAGAGLDVYEDEPAIHPVLPTLDNVVLAPHLGSATEEGRIAMGQKVIDNILAFAAGEPLPDRV